MSFQLLLFPEGTDLTERTRAKSDEFARKKCSEEFTIVQKHNHHKQIAQQCENSVLLGVNSQCHCCVAAHQRVG